MKKLRVGVVGVGHLGRHHARILSGMPGVILVGVADSSAARCAEVAALCGTPAFEDFRTLIPRVDAALIVVPTSAHFEVASAFLKAGKPVLVEKPLTSDPNQAAALVELARRHGLIVQVGHIERFNPVLRAIPAHDHPPRLIEARRVGPYSFRSTDISVVFDLMIHDLDIILSLVGEAPERVQATGWSMFGGLEDVATAQLAFRCGTVAHLTASRADVAPRREMTLRWTHSIAQLDFAKQHSVTSMPKPAFSLVGSRFVNPPPQQIASLREGLHGHYFDVSERDWSGGPELLSLELEHFIACVLDDKEPLVNGDRGRMAVELADRVQRAARNEFTVELPRAA
jgi:predicted dehydrogenase